MDGGEQSGEGGGRDEGVEPVHQAAVAGNEAARILDAEPALERRIRTGRRVPTRPRPQARARTAGRSGSPTAKRSRPSAAPANAPAIAPDQVLPGDTLGQSFGPPISRPAK